MALGGGPGSNSRGRGGPGAGSTARVDWAWAAGKFVSSAARTEVVASVVMGPAGVCSGALLWNTGLVGKTRTGPLGVKRHCFGRTTCCIRAVGEIEALSVTATTKSRVWVWKPR